LTKLKHFEFEFENLALKSNLDFSIRFFYRFLRFQSIFNDLDGISRFEVGFKWINIREHNIFVAWLEPLKKIVDRLRFPSLVIRLGCKHSCPNVSLYNKFFYLLWFISLLCTPKNIVRLLLLNFIIKTLDVCGIAYNIYQLNFVNQTQ
jgi:hypothetical protein